MYTPLHTFIDIHKGKRAYVCGSGTSLSDTPINLSEYGVVIAVNAAGLHFNKYQYLFITDPSVMYMSYWEEVVRKAGNIIFANREFESGFERLNKMYGEQGKVSYLLTRNYEDHHNYQFGNTSKLCLGSDAPVPATHFAYTLGCRPIILCGIDLCFNKQGTRYFNQMAAVHAPASPFEEAFTQGLEDSKINTPHGMSDKWLEESLAFWEKIYWQTPDARHVVFNASPISAVPHFQKVDIKDCL